MITLQQIRVNDPSDIAQVCDHAHTVFVPGLDHVVARVRDGELLGGVHFNQYHTRSIAMHVAGFHPRWLSREYMWAVFAYPFLQLPVEKIFAKIPSAKPEVIGQAIRLGFIHEATLTDVFPHSDLVILSMYKRQCRWLQLRDNHHG